MAIARVGKRFGVFDIRIGLPRDKGFDPVEASKRINQRANPQTTVNKFRALISSGEGLARSNKFIAVINFPSGVTAQTDFDGSEFQEYQTATEFTTNFAIGDAVNLAARLESSTKEVGEDIVIGYDTISSSNFSDQIILKELESIFVKGKEKPIKIYTLQND